MSGTSMASPHVAGAVALLNQRLPELYPGLEGAELSNLVKALLMSSARPHYNAETGAYTSPRQQGAGLIDVDNALNSGIYLTGADNYPSISLRNVGDTFEFDINVYNISDEDQVLDITTHLATDGVEADLLGNVITLTPRHLKDVPEGQLEIAARSHQTVTISVDAREFSEELLGLMPNGYFLEGFVSFGNAQDSLLASIPFVGFRGDFANLDVVEKTVYEYGFNLEEDFADAPFYYVDLTTGTTTTDYTGLISIDEDEIITLGEDTVSHFGSGEEIVLAISPNDDGKKDFVAFQGVFLRNYEDFVASVYHLNELGEEELIWQGEPSWGTKNHYSDNPGRPKSTIELSSLWLGQEANDEFVEDGLYRYELSFRSQVPVSLSQLLSFNVYLSTTQPKANRAVFDEATRQLTLTDLVDVYPGLNPYCTRISAGEAPDRLYLALGLAEDTREHIYLNGSDDYTFTLPETVDIYDPGTTLYLEDYAGNFSEIVLYDILHGEGGVVEFRLIDAADGEDLTAAGLRVRVRDAEGNIVVGERLDGNSDQNVQRLPYGTYTAEIFLINEEYLEVVDGDVREFTVSEDNPWQTVELFANYIERVDFRVDLNQPVPEGGAIYLVDAEGNETLVPATSYVDTVHQVRVEAGDYTLRVDLPEGYTSEQDGLAVTISAEQSGVDVVIERVEVDKTELAELIDLANQVDRDTITAGDSLILDVVLNNATVVYENPEATQAEVDNAVTALQTQLENIEILDPLADEREAAKAEISNLDLLPSAEVTDFHAQVDAAETAEAIDQVVADAQTRQQLLDDEAQAQADLEAAKAEAVSTIEALPNLAAADKAGFVD